jgi:hypothetical protein
VLVAFNLDEAERFPNDSMFEAAWVLSRDPAGIPVDRQQEA